MTLRKIKLFQPLLPLLAKLASPLARVLICACFLLVALWGLYGNIIEPLREEATLPALFAGTQASLDEKTLAIVLDATVQRQQYIPHEFTPFASIFAPLGQ